MNTAILAGNSGFGGEGGNIGIGFAVPSNLAKQVLDQIEKTGKVSRGYMGVTLESVTPELAPHFGLSEPHGAIVGTVTPKAPGANAGLKNGDVITAIDGKKVQGSDDLTMNVISHAPGSQVTLDVVRDGKPMKVNVTLGQRPSGVNWNQSGQNGDSDDSDKDDSDNSGNVSARGISVENLTPDIARQAGVEPGTRGVIITDVDQSSPAADASIGRGLVIVAVNRTPVANVQDFKRQMNEAQGKSVLLTINQGGQNLFVVVPAKQ